MSSESLLIWSRTETHTHRPLITILRLPIGGAGRSNYLVDLTGDRVKSYTPFTPFDPTRQNFFVASRRAVWIGYWRYLLRLGGLISSPITVVQCVTINAVIECCILFYNTNMKALSPKRCISKGLLQFATAWHTAPHAIWDHTVYCYRSAT